VFEMRGEGGEVGDHAVGLFPVDVVPDALVGDQA
jgi:hypothetical protein